jgi:hypothetical protein
MKQAIMILSHEAQYNMVNGIKNGLLSEELVVKIAEFCKDLPHSVQVITVRNIIDGSIVLE